jgi:type VI secretion system protein ImpJ
LQNQRKRFKRICQKISAEWRQSTGDSESMTTPKRPILWHQGLFLQPQHFQQFDLYIQSLFTPFQQHMQPYFWGVANLKIQEASLQNRMFEILNVEAIFPDGIQAAFPGNAVLQARSFKSIDFGGEGGKPFRVYLGLRKFNPAARNATAIRGSEDLYSLGARFISHVEPESVEDLYIGGPAAKTRYMDYVLKIFWETEVEGLADYWLMPIAQLELQVDRVQISQEFIPPAACIAGSEHLRQILKNIQEYIRSRSQVLEMYKLVRNVHPADMQPVSLRNLLALTVINRYVPLMHHFIETTELHPWTAYGLLRQLIGELSTFSERIDALGRLADGRGLLPGYDHCELGRCFYEAQRLIKELLSAIVVGEENIVRLTREGSDFKGQIPAETIAQATRFILSVTASGASEAVVHALTKLAKVGSVEEMPTMIARALPGIPLEWRPTPPPGLPERPDVYYFSLKTDHALWTDIRRTGNICLHWADAPENAVAELIISRA